MKKVFPLFFLFSISLISCDWGVSKRAGEQKTSPEAEIPSPKPEVSPHPECPNIPADLPITKAPIPYEWAPYNLFSIWKKGYPEDPQYWEKYMAELKAYPPRLMGGQGFHGHVMAPFMWGSVHGVADEIYGDGYTPGIGTMLDKGVFPPEKLKIRFDEIKRYLAEYEGVTKLFPYLDFGTQIYGNHLTRTGFWNFYDQWDSFAALFDIGPKPPDPTTWLRRFYDNTKQNPAFPDELAGFHFFYGPKKPAYDSAAHLADPTQPTYYRYSVNILSQGWEMWWKQIFRWTAKLGYKTAFIDNTIFQSCWNTECQEGYRQWIQKNFTPEQIENFLGPLSSLTLPAGEELWHSSARFKRWTMARYFESVVNERLMYLRNAAREIDPSFELFPNSYLPWKGADYFMVEGHAHEFEYNRQEVSYAPGVYRPGVYQPSPPAPSEPYQLKQMPVTSEIVGTNIFDYKYNHSRRFPDFFGYILHQSRGTGPYYAHNADSALLEHAEAAAFGGGGGIDLGLRSQPHYGNQEERLALREVGKKFFQFVDAHRDLYECLRSHAEVALVHHDVASKDSENRILDIAIGLARRGILWDILTDDRITPTTLPRYKAIVYHDIERLSEAEAQALISFLQAGGVVVMSGKSGTFDDFMRPRIDAISSVWPPVPLHATQAAVYPVGTGKLISVPGGMTDLAFVMTEIETQLKRPLSIFPSLSGRALERMRASAWEGNNRLILHLVNYDVPLGKENANQVTPLSNVEVRIKLPGSWAPTSVTLYSPEPSGSSGAVPLTKHEDGTIGFTVPSLRIYEAAVIE